MKEILNGVLEEYKIDIETVQPVKYIYFTLFYISINDK